MAGLVEDPGEYRWGGYAAALGGEKVSREGLMQLTGQRSWVKAAEVWRMWLFTQGTGDERGGTDEEMDEEEAGGESEGSVGRSVGRKRGRGGVDGVKRARVMREYGRMSAGELLRCRVRYFTDGLVIGSREYVERYRRRDEQDKRRVPLMRELAGKRGERMCVMRQLRAGVMSDVVVESSELP
jgi:putative transposase